jgi:hypothetical protein
MYPKEQGDRLREWMCHFQIRLDHVARHQEEEEEMGRRARRKFWEWVKKRFPSFGTESSELSGFLRKRKAFMISVQDICFGSQDDSMTLVAANGNCTFMEKTRTRFELSCPEEKEEEKGDEWFVLDEDIHVSKGQDGSEAARAQYRRRHLPLFIRNLFRFHELPYEKKLAMDALYFLEACL